MHNNINFVGMIICNTNEDSVVLIGGPRWVGYIIAKFEHWARHIGICHVSKYYAK